MSDKALCELIDPATRGNRSMAVRLWRSRELIFTLVKRDLKIRYKSSALGFLWSFGKPLLLMLVIAAVFSALIGIRAGHDLLPYPLHVLTGLLPWMFFAGALSDSLYSVIGNSNVVKKVWLPTEVFPASVVIGQLIHFALAMLILAVFIVAYALFGHLPADHGGGTLGWLVMPSWEILLLPFLVLLQSMFAFGLCLILASLNVFYRDMASITEIVLSAWFYITPIIYPANFARVALQQKGMEHLYWMYLCNPMTPITLAYRRIIYGNMFRGGPEVSDATLIMGLGISFISSVIVLWFGIRLYQRMSKRFADEL